MAFPRGGQDVRGGLFVFGGIRGIRKAMSERIDTQVTNYTGHIGYTLLIKIGRYWREY
jgi:hypothetical protein